jgi:predicted TIM-barrel fold metal-dependent hydrolase
MIDTHIHCVPPNLPGVGSLAPELRDTPAGVARLLRDEMQAAGVRAALAMGSAGGGDDDPLGVARTLEIAALVPGLFAIGIADPRRTDPEHLRRVEQQLADRRVIALKCYLGYLHYSPSDPGYRPYFEIAARHKLPVVCHTGDTYSPNAKLKYAHPLGVDEVAVDHPDVRFILAHVGNPWMTDAAEVIYKNMNVWADLSGLFVGSEEILSDPAAKETIRETIERVRSAFRYAERPNRFLYGSDWPLAPMTLYRDLIQTAIPEAHHEQVFVENARTLFAALRG